jgi:hypothetical protein
MARSKRLIVAFGNSLKIYLRVGGRLRRCEKC